jgi:hypothetical protein
MGEECACRGRLTRGWIGPARAGRSSTSAAYLLKLTLLPAVTTPCLLSAGSELHSLSRESEGRL